MKCQDIREKFPDILIGEIEQQMMKTIQEHIADCVGCREELENLSLLWAKLEVIPEEQPGPGVREGFYAMLESQKRETEDRVQTKQSMSWIKRLMHNILIPQTVFQNPVVYALLILGFVGGYIVHSFSNSSGEFAALQQEVQQTRQLVALSLLKQPSASDRIMGAAWSRKVEEPDQETLKVLIDILNNDTSSNVRLSALDSLTRFYDYPYVREQLIRSLMEQSSPIVQIALIDLMGEMRDDHALPVLNQLVMKEGTNEQVKTQAKNCIQKLSSKTKI
ncbi:MAG: hypothetical protein A2Y62_22120 [Candidatus Fischerbacteria bacterium RBG_13_37_8]|uniref:Zinc-finger domain-containing protein n=1 Tax=Candidatus Fischerbacteria bacterium RBG_13_37_8 TaxID=1817863 RepID=A0A1F5VXI0_9BACT|nr:MAG: hypothetical protein A2Y62_22120 [Candidatus Fischerbacteria bacterium RBG_13_37_8]